MADTTRLRRINRGRGHSYTLDGRKVPGVTTILKTLAKPALIDWSVRKGAEHAVNHWDELAELPISERLDRIKRAPSTDRDHRGERGTEIHTYAEQLVHGQTVTPPDDLRGPVEAVARWLDRWRADPVLTEAPVANTTYGYAGTADLFAVLRRPGEAAGDGVTLVDFKSSRGVYSEAAIQCAAYRFCDLAVHDGAEYDVPPVERVLIAHVGDDDVRTIPVTADGAVWHAFLHLLQVHRAEKRWKDEPIVHDALREPEDEPA